MSAQMKATLQTIATEARECFEYDKERKIWLSKHNDPHWNTWVKDMVFTAHDDMMPDDTKYKFIIQALDLIIEAGEPADLDEIESEIEPDIYTPDIYTTELTAWLATNINRVYYLTQAIEEFEPKDQFEVLGFAQLLEKQEVFRAVRQGLEARLKTLNNAEDAT